MDQPNPDWSGIARPPGDLYELLGLPRFDPDTDEILTAVRAAHRRWRPYLDHRRPEVAGRARDLMAQLGRARDVFGDPAKHAAYDRDLMRSLNGDDPRRGPAEEHGVRPTRLESLLEALLPSGPADVSRPDAESTGMVVPTERATATTQPEPRWIVVRQSPWEELAGKITGLLRRGLQFLRWSRNEGLLIPVLAVALIAVLLVATQWKGVTTPVRATHLASVSDGRRPTPARPGETTGQDGGTATAPGADSAPGGDGQPPAAPTQPETKVRDVTDPDASTRPRSASHHAPLGTPTVEVPEAVPGRETFTPAEPGNVPDGRGTATVSGDGTLTLTGHTQDVLDSEFSRDGRLLASASRDGTVKIWEARTGRALHTLTGHTGPVLSVSFHPGGRLLASAGEDGTMKLWDVNTGKDLLTLKGHDGPVGFVAFRADGRRLFSSGDDATVREWDMVSGGEFTSERRSFPTASRVVLGRDGKLTAMVDSQGQIQVRTSGTRGLPLALKGYAGRVHGMAFSPDGRYLASACSDGTVRLWDVFVRRQLPPFAEPIIGAHGVAFSPGGRYLAVAGDDGTVRVLVLSTGRQVLEPGGHDGPALGVTFSPDGRRLASTGRDGTVRVWDVPLPGGPGLTRGYDQPDPQGRRLAPETTSPEAYRSSMPPFDPPARRPGDGLGFRGVPPARPGYVVPRPAEATRAPR
jgi:WD40 repeat protein